DAGSVRSSIHLGVSMSLRLAGTPALEPPSSSYTLGVEEELFAVDADDLTPMACSEVLVGNGRRPARGRVTGELCDGVVELATPICTDTIDAVDALRDLRREVVRGGLLTLLGTGVHPTLCFGDVAHRQSPH